MDKHGAHVGVGRVPDHGAVMAQRAGICSGKVCDDANAWALDAKRRQDGEKIGTDRKGMA